jgi:hypothetical protein
LHIDDLRNVFPGMCTSSVPWNSDLHFVLKACQLYICKKSLFWHLGFHSQSEEGSALSLNPQKLNLVAATILLFLRIISPIPVYYLEPYIWWNDAWNTLQPKVTDESRASTTKVTTYMF